MDTTESEESQGSEATRQQQGHNEGGEKRAALERTKVHRGDERTLNAITRAGQGKKALRKKEMKETVKIQAVSPTSPELSEVDTPESEESQGSDATRHQQGHNEGGEESAQHQERDEINRDMYDEMEKEGETEDVVDTEANQEGRDTEQLQENEEDLIRFQEEIGKLSKIDGVLLASDLQRAQSIRTRIMERYDDHNKLPSSANFQHRVKQADRKLRDIRIKIRRMRKNGDAAAERRAREKEWERKEKEIKEREDKEKKENDNRGREERERQEEREAARLGVGAILESIEDTQKKEDAELVICTFTGARVIAHKGNKNDITYQMELEGRYIDDIPHVLATILSEKEVEKYLANNPSINKPTKIRKKKLIELPYEQIKARAVDIDRKIRTEHILKGHQSFGQMRREWLDPTSQMRERIGEEFPLSFTTIPCAACNKQKPKPKRGTTTFTGPNSGHGKDRSDMYPGEMISIDGVDIPIEGDEPWRGHGGVRSAVIATDLRTRYAWVVGNYSGKSNMNDVRKVVNIVDHEIVTHNGPFKGGEPRTIRTDAFTTAAKGVGHGSRNLTLQGRLMGDKGIKLTTSLPYQQWGNYTENNNRKIRQKSNVLMNHAGTIWEIPEHLRLYAINHAALLINIKKDHKNTTRPDADIELDTSPYELLKGRAFNEKNLHTFGARAWYTDEQRSSKGQDRRKMGYHIGISAEEKGWYIYCPETDRVVETRNVCFDDLNETSDDRESQKEMEVFAVEDINTNFITLTDEISPEMARRNMTLMLREDNVRDVGRVEITHQSQEPTEGEDEYVEAMRVEVQRFGDKVRWTEESDYLKERTPEGLDERLIVMVDENGEELTLITRQTFQELQEQAKHEPEDEDMQWEGDHESVDAQIQQMITELNSNGYEWQDEEEDEHGETETTAYGVKREGKDEEDKKITITDPNYKPPKHRHNMSRDIYKDHYRAAEATELRKLHDKGFIEYWSEEKYQTHLEQGGNKAVPFRWAYNVKMSKQELGRVDIFKARLALRGDLQKDDFEPHEKYAPTASQEVIRTVTMIGLMHDMNHHQYDAPCAFLNAEPSKPTVCTPIPGYTIRDTRGRAMYPFLKKNLYGSVEAGKRWADVVKEFLLERGFTQTITDPTVFVNKERKMTCVVYVDDFSLGFKEDRDRIWLEKEMSEAYEMKMEGPIANYVGVRYTKTDRGYFMDQELRVRALAARLGIKKGLNTRTPYKTVKPFGKLELDDHEETRKELEKTYGFHLRNVIGEMLHIAQTTRPDVSVAISALASHARMVSDEIFRETVRMVRYLLTTCDLGVHVTTEDIGEGITAHVDASYMSDRNAHGLSRYGIAITIGSTLIAWKTSFLPKTHTSTTAAEFQTLNIGAEKAMEIQALAEEIRGALDDDYKGGKTPEMRIDPTATIRPITVREDNEPAANAAKSRKGANFETRQTAAAYWKVRAAIMEGHVNIKVVGTKHQIADFLTKKLTPKEFERLRGFYVRKKHELWPPTLEGGGKFLGQEKEEGHNM